MRNVRYSRRTRPVFGRSVPSAGFTLLEVLIAVAILGIVLVTVYGTLTRTIAAKDHAEEIVNLSSVGREAVLRIADEIEGSLSPSVNPDAVFQGVSSGSGQFADQVRFVILSRPPFGPIGGTGGRVVITYSLDQMQGSDKVFILRRDEVPLTTLPDPSGNGTNSSDSTGSADGSTSADGTQQPQPLSILVTDNVAGLRFRYLDGVSRQWVNDWDSTSQDFLDRLPLAVEIALYLYDSKGNIHDYSTIVDLPLANFGQPTPTPGP